MYDEHDDARATVGLLLLIPILLCILSSGCSWLGGGDDPDVLSAKATADEALVEAKAARVALAEVEARHARGEATAEEVAAAKAAFEARAQDADARIAALDSTIKTVSAKSAPLAGWGATAGSIFGPVGTAIGGLLGTIGAGIMAWRRSKTLRGVLLGVQAAREELHRTAPDALAKSDDAMKRMIPADIQETIRTLKKSGALGELPS